MAHERYLADLRDLKFVLFEHLKIDRLFELERFADFDRHDIEMLLAEGARFARQVLAPANEAGDREGCRFENGRVYVPRAFHNVHSQQRDAGWLAMSTEREYGGQGLPFVVGAALGEMFIGANCSLAMLAGLTRAAATMIIRHGTEVVKRQYLPNLIAGRWQGTMCLTEPHAGTAVGSINTLATKRDGQYYIRGQKIFISGGDHDLVDNVIHLVLARCEGAPPGTKGLSLFVIPKHRVDTSGKLREFNDVTCVGIEEKLGIHGSPTCAMSFGDNGRCLGELVGEEQQGIELMFEMMNAARVGVGLQGVAMGSAAYLAALAYARERIQGCELKNIRDPNAPLVPITRHPDVRRMLATMKAYVEGGRALLLHAAMCLDLVEHSPDASLRQRLADRVELLTPICKAWCSDTGFEAAVLALQTLGGHGYLKDYPIEQLVRDVKIASIYEGTNGIQAIDLLARKVGRKQGTLFVAFLADIEATLTRHAAHPELATSVALLARRKRQLEQTAMNFAMQQMSGDIDYPLLSATPFLRMFGNVVVGWLLVEQGAVAHEALEELYRNAKANTPEARAAWCAEHTEGQFYGNKVKTARFFCSMLLAENDGLAAAIESGDRSALEMHF